MADGCVCSRITLPEPLSEHLYPRKAWEAMPRQAMSTPSDSSTIPPRRRVLCVDDNKFVREALCFTLDPAKYEIECAADGREALRRIEGAHDAFQILVTDHCMPFLSGLELVRHLGAQKRALEIVVITGGLNPEAEGEYRKLGVRKIIYKPFFPDELIEVMNSISAG